TSSATHVLQMRRYRWVLVYIRSWSPTAWALVWEATLSASQGRPAAPCARASATETKTGSSTAPTLRLCNRNLDAPLIPLPGWETPTATVSSIVVTLPRCRRISGGRVRRCSSPSWWNAHRPSGSDPEKAVDYDRVCQFVRPHFPPQGIDSSRKHEKGRHEI